MIKQLKDRNASDIFPKLNDVLFESTEGVTAGADGRAVTVKESVVNFAAVVIISKKGNGIADVELNKTIGFGTGTIWWFNNGYQGTFYNNTIYKVIGIGRR